MLRGTVTFRARIRGDGLTFPLCEFDPGQAGVDKVEIEGRNGDKIMRIVHLGSVATKEEGEAIATKVHTAALNRISFHHDIIIENGRISGTAFSPLSPPSDSHDYIELESRVHLRDEIQVTMRLNDAATLKMELEQASRPCEQYFGLLRSARQSMSPVEEFVHLYNLLRMLLGDTEIAVDNFIKRESPTAPQTPSPHRSGVETVYTRLRSELAHPARGVNVDQTKREMAQWVGGLVGLTKRAIELSPLRKEDLL